MNAGSHIDLATIAAESNSTRTKALKRFPIQLGQKLDRAPVLTDRTRSVPLSKTDSSSTRSYPAC